MDRPILAFPLAVSGKSSRNPQPASPSAKATAATPDALNHPRRLYLYNPTQEDLIHRSLDLASQIGITVSRIDREIAATARRDRNRRIFPTATLPAEN